MASGTRWIARLRRAANWAMVSFLPGEHEGLLLLAEAAVYATPEAQSNGLMSGERFGKKRQRLDGIVDL
eukprot:7101822-Pyramimonas_sp.AAC.1